MIEMNCMLPKTLSLEDREVIPTVLRQEMVQKVHESHMGVEKSLQRAKDIMFWPRMTSDITDYVLTCNICLQYRQSNTKEPLGK